ncbi:hypothetical protein CRYUN_Cryun04dG0032400 [Craigia yunnanensis]
MTLRLTGYPELLLHSASTYFSSAYSIPLLTFLGPPSALLGDLRKRPEDFTVVPEWIDYPCNIAFKLHEMVSHQECVDEDVSDSQRIGQVIQGCQFVTMRSCSEFEPDQIQLLSKLYQKPVVPVGLLPPSLPSNEDKRDEEWEVTKKWLDSKEEKSVFYVALGSEGLGVERLGSSTTDISSLLCWGFLTHCGWSSIIEALKLGRALILFSGASSDQGLNARLLHGKKVGLEIERNEQEGSFTSDLVAQTIRQVMVEPEGELIRSNAWAMRETFDNEELSNNYLEGFNRLIEEFAPSA